jgi:protein ImuB
MIMRVLLEWNLEPDPGALLQVAPRVTVDEAGAWLDVRGLELGAVHASLVEALGVGLRAGAGLRPVVAEVAAGLTQGGGLTVVPAGGESEYLTDVPLAELGVPEPLLGWLADVGVGRCGELAAVEREALEVRFGGGAVEWWRRSRGEDERRLFRRVPLAQPHASIDFIDYVVTDPERLVFVANALLGSVCAEVSERGSHARRLLLRLTLANGGVWERTLRAARPTADRSAWLRLARGLLERLTVPDSVSGMSVEVEATEAAASIQGDLFDTGFATSSAVELALARVVEDQGEVVREPVSGAHPLVEVRGEYRAVPLGQAVATPATHATPAALPASSSAVALEAAAQTADEPVGLTLQLLDEPRRVTVETARRRDHQVPVRYRDGRWREVVNAAGPDRVSGGQWDTTYAREYYRVVTADGALVWLFRDAARDRWYLHGWWD